METPASDRALRLSFWVVMQLPPAAWMDSVAAATTASGVSPNSRYRVW